MGSSRVKKSDPRLQAYGTVDELNALIGVCHSLIQTESHIYKDHSLSHELIHIQNQLFKIGSLLACEDQNSKTKLPQLSEQEVLLLENSMDKMHKDLAPLRNFILPGGHPHSAYLQYARTVCRRAERLCVELGDKVEQFNNSLFKST